MTSTNDKLARMANQIAGFFRSYPEDAAIAGIHEHIVAFWAPRMRADLEAVIDDESMKLDPLVVAAFRRSIQGASPAHRETAGPETVGSMGSDAG